MKKKYVFIILISMFLMLISITGTVSATNHTVNPGDSIQSVINNASSNDTIIVNDNNGSAYTYTGNLIINKTLQLKAKSGSKVTIRASNSSKPSITVNSLGTGAFIQGFTIIGATNSSGIYLNGVLSCNITGNSLNGNYYGVYLYGSSSNNIVSGNTIANSTYSGIILNSNNNTMQNNILTGNLRGILLSGGNYNTIQNNTITNTGSYGIGLNNADNNIFQKNTITGSTSFGLNIQNGSNGNIIRSNVIKNNNYGIYILNSSITITFNEITGNTVHGLYSVNGTANAINNWWGSNNLTVSSSSGSDIYGNGGTVTYNPWLVLTIGSSSDIVSKSSSSSVTADLTRNNQGTNTSSSGTVPDGIPVNFSKTLGTISSPVSTRNGKATATFNSGTTAGTATVSAVLDRQTVNKTITIISGVYNTRTKKTFSTIQAAINDATTSNGDTILLGGGTYAANIVISKRLSLMPAYGGNVILQASNSSLPTVTAFYGGSGSLIKGFTIRGATNSYGVYISSYVNSCNVTGNIITNNLYGILIDANSTRISGNNITGNAHDGIYFENVNNNYITGNNVTANGGNGIINYYSRNNAISGNKVANNTGNGIVLYYANNNTVSGNNVIGNIQEGIFLYNSNSTIVSGNNVTGNNADGIAIGYANNNTLSGNNLTANVHNGIDISYANNNTISGNSISGNNVTVVGVHIEYSSTNRVSGNNITCNSISGIFFNDARNNTISGNNVTGNDRGIYLYNSNSTVVSGNNVKDNILDGICLDSSNNNTISVNNASFNGLNGIIVGYANNNTISGNNATNNVHHGIYLDHANGNCVSGNIASNNVLSGICADSSNNTTLVGSKVTDNDQMGIFITYSNGILISGNNVTKNGINGTIYGGIIIGYSNNSTISENNITNNTENGILLYNSRNDIIFGNNVTNNTEGIALQNASNITISMNNAINSILNGITLLYSSNNTISRNNVTNNHYAGIYVDNSDSTRITENTIINNQNGIYLYFSPATVNFNRIARNSVGGLINAYSSFVNATNNWWGTNNPTVSSSNVSDICILGGNVIYNPWIVLAVNSVHCINGTFNITADLTHNNHGTDLSQLGHVPDGIIINFTTDYGTIVRNVNTINGKAVSQLNSTVNSIANITVTLDNQIVSKTVNIFNIYNTVTQKGFSSIQAAIDDLSTSDGDVIEIMSGTYRENIVVNKRIVIMAFPGENVTIQAVNSLSSIVTVNPGVTVTIFNLIFANGNYASGPGGAIYNRGNLTVINCTFRNNTAYWGGAICNGGNLTVTGSTFMGNTAIHDGGAINSNNVLNVNNCVFTNNVAQHVCGAIINWQGTMNVTGSGFTGNTAAMEGSTIGNYYGSANINFNRIVVSGNYGLYNANGGVVNATNNWWGSNTDPTTNSSNIRNNGGTVTYNPWLVLNLTANPTRTNGNSTVTADLTHNSNGADTSSGGHVPDNIPVNFTTTLGNMASPVYTRNGKAILTFNSGTVTSGVASVTATLDGQILQMNITIDAIAPTVNATLATGLYNITQYVNLTASDAVDLNPVIYYTTDGSTPTTSSTVYVGPILLTTTTTLKFMAVDFTGNKSPVGIKYYIFSPVGNLNTGLGYSSIQNAIDDILTVNGNIIVVANGTYLENIVLNKNLTITPYDGNVTIQAASPNSPIITINSGGNGSLILGFTLTGANGTSSSGIYLNNASNCTIMGNILTSNYYGLLLASSTNNTIWDNNLTGNLIGGIWFNSSDNNTIYSNNIANNSGHGIYLYNSGNTLIMANTIQNNLRNGIELNNSSNSTIYENTITDNHQNGIKSTLSSADINFNIITGNTLYGFYSIGNGALNATNNWWGKNNPIVSSTSPSDINMAGGTVTYDPWLVLSLTGSIITVTHNNTSNCEITADLTQDNHGNDTSSSGTIPDGLPVNFTTTLGTINSTGTIRSGRAIVILTSSPSDGATTVAATVNNWQVSKAFHKSFSSIQSAVNDPLTIDGDVIFVTNGTYIENIVVNKNLTIISEGNVTVQALNSSNPVFTVNDCSDSMIYGFTITDATHSSAIYLNRVSSCYVLDNTIAGNGLNSTGDFGYGIFLNSTTNCTVSGNILQNNLGGIDLEYSNNTLLSGNNITNSMLGGIYLYQANNTTISGNNLANNDCGILSEYSNNLTVTSNDIKNNTYQGIYLYNSSGDLHFNRIVGNGEYGLLSRGGTVNATNNWWGTNNPAVSSAKPSAIYVISGSVLYNPWLVLTITPTSYKVSDGKIYESTITADLNHNSNGEYLSTITYIPEGIPVNFTTDNGTITNSSSTVKGEASATLVLNPNLQSGLTNVTANVDGQNVSAAVDRSANATILIASTAIDLSTGQPLSLSYVLPLNESVSWVSVLWKSTSSDFGVFQNEVDLIVNGAVVLNRTVSNINYLYYKTSYSQKVWYNVNFLNWLFSESAASKMALKSIIEQNPELQNLTGDDLEIGILNIIKENNGFTDSEMNMIANHRYFTDDIATYIKYPGDAAKKITVEDPDSNELIDLDFPGNPISRVSTMIYANGGYFHVDDPVNPTSIVYKYAGYEGVRSFAIVTTKVTDDILQYWLDQKDRTDVNGTLLYPDGPMKAAYGTFLEALLMIKCHDMVADQAAAQYNVSWTRTTPIIVSVFDDAYRTVLTLECSHRFGMDVIGDVSNITAFRYACSSAINPIEHMVGESLFPGGNSTSIVMGLGQMILNGEMVDLFMSNGYFVMKSANNTLFLVLDPETGILRDVMVVNSSLSGSWCYSDQQAEWAHDLGEKLLSSIENIPWMSFIPILGINLNMFGSSGSILPGSGSLMSIFEYVGVDGPAAEVLASLTRFAKNPLTAAVIGVGITTFVVGNYLCDKYNWPPHRDFNQDVQTVKDSLYNSASKTAGFLISSLFPLYRCTELYNMFSKKEKETYDKINGNLQKQLDRMASDNSADSEPGAGGPDKKLDNFFKNCRKLIDDGMDKIKHYNVRRGIIEVTIGMSGMITVGGTWAIYEILDALGPTEVPGNNSTNGTNSTISGR